ncbi:MAG: 1-deoxy-D-xylulose-5-phosphate reductoisomerase [Sedimentisphaerales bacterium]|nr:1-deoxy-D-xylulose-5-phosphate reductoisomerase [Sedimentisphaerales bacterium]
MSSNRKRIVILGSTGSIGSSCLSVLDGLQDRYELVAASAHTQWQALAQQARKYGLEKVVLTDPAAAGALAEDLAGTPTEVLAGPEHLIDLAADKRVDVVIVAVVGSAGLPAVLAATRAGKTIAIANKESLVVAGCLLMPLARQYGATILPIDSEHSAILQAMRAGSPDEVERVIITCSGGPFRGASPQQLAQASLEDALNHPTWEMGPKITIDSATLMNKALEIVEARWLFDLPVEKIAVLIHPESIIHSMVEFCDGSIIAQLSPPDMRLPIQYALTYPGRRDCPARKLNLTELRQLTFEPPDPDRFGALRLGFDVARRAGTAGAVLNAANEEAVAAFRRRQIAFLQITELTEQCLHDHPWKQEPSLDDLLEADRWARQRIRRLVPAAARATPAGPP